MKKKILIFQSGEPIHLDKSPLPMRLINLTDILLKYGYQIEILTTRFSHQEKKFRNREILSKNNQGNIKYTLLESTGYKKNISLKRLYDHLILAKNLRKKLKEIKNIDYVFMGYPPIEACFILARWCLNRRIPYIVDYKDLWPELFMHNKNSLIKILLFPIIFSLKILRNFILKNSSGISIISNSFLDSLKLENIKQKKITCYLTKKKSFNVDTANIRNDILLKFPSKKIKIVFIGNFMTDAFDFKVLKKIKNFIEKSQLLEFYFFGSGPSKKKVEENLNFKNINIGDRVNFSEFQYIMGNSQAVFLPINNRFDYLKSIPNKIVDAINYKLPIFTSLGGEAKSLIEKFEIGFFYKNHETLLQNLVWFCDNKNHKLFKKNYDNSELQTLFDHDSNYKKILNKIEFDLNNRMR